MINFLKKVAVFFMFAGCSQARHVDLADKTIFSFSKEVFFTDDLQLIAEGGALYEDIKGLDLVYTTQKQLNLNEARQLVVSVAERFLNKVNSDEEIRPYLHKYPFTVENLSLDIGFYSRSQYVGSNYIASVSIPNIDPDRPTDRIYYRVYDASADRLIDVHEESYSEALEIVRQQIKRDKSR